MMDFPRVGIQNWSSCVTCAFVDSSGRHFQVVALLWIMNRWGFTKKPHCGGVQLSSAMVNLDCALSL
jgi:hypothetical protein